MPGTTSSADAPEPLVESGGTAVELARGELERVLGPERAKAYGRYLEWSVGEGFLLAVVELRRPSVRDALVASTRAAVLNALHVRLDRIGTRPLFTALEEACSTPADVSLLVLTHLEEARELDRICAELNVHRTELVQRFALPWVLIIHPAAALDLQRKAPDFCDFAGLWLPEEVEESWKPTSLVQRQNALATRDAPFARFHDERMQDASEAIAGYRLDEAADLLTQDAINQPDARSPMPQRLYQEGRLLLARGLLDDAFTRFEEALRLYEAAGDSLAKAYILDDMAQIWLRRGDKNAARQLLEEALGIVTSSNRRREQAFLLRRMAIIEQTASNYAEARTLLDQSIHLDDSLGDRLGRAASLHQLAMIEELEGNYVEARTLLYEAIQTNRLLGNSSGLAAALHQLAIVESAQGAYDESRSLLREALRINDEIGDLWGYSASLHVLSIIEANEGNYVEARSLIDESLKIKEAIKDHQGRAASLHQLANVELSQGNRRKARELLEQAIHLSKEFGNQEGEAASLVMLGQIKASEGEAAEGRALVQKGVNLLKGLNVEELARAQSILDSLEHSSAEDSEEPPLAG